MKKIIPIILTAILLNGCLSRVEPAIETAADYGFDITAFVIMLASGEYEQAWGKFDDIMQMAIPTSELPMYWNQIEMLLGSFHKVIGTTVDEDFFTGELLVEIASLHDDPNMISLTTIQYTIEGRVSELHFNIIPISDYAREPDIHELFIDEPVYIGAEGEYPLNGLLSMPTDAAGPIPAVVLVHGSGPNDMNQTLGSIKPFKDIAHYLVQHGIAVLRYDKRSYTHGMKMMAELGGNLTVYEEVIEDALLAKQLLKTDPRIDSDRIFVLGHSLGGILAPEIAAAGDFAGFIIMAGTLRSLPELMVEQYEYLLDNVPEEVSEPLIAEVREGYELYLEALEMPKEEAAAIPLFGISAYYFTDMARRHPSQFITGWSKPALILHGDMDYQYRWYIDFKEYQELTAHMNNVTSILYENLTHLFTQSHNQAGMGTPDDYIHPEHVDQEVLEDIAAFIQGN